jgi:hypothetical protein
MNSHMDTNAHVEMVESARLAREDAARIAARIAAARKAADAVKAARARNTLWARILRAISR